MNTPQDSSLGREVSYPDRYDPGLLFPIPRAGARAELGLDPAAPVPFIGHDRWHLFELSWLDARGKPVAATATLQVPADSPCLIESKSLKLYFNSLNGQRLADADALQARVVTDLSTCAGAPVFFALGLPPMARAEADGQCLDEQEADFDCYGPPNPTLLQADPSQLVEQRLYSNLLKSNCPVTGQPDWASVHLHYVGPKIDPLGLLRYIVSFREHAGFHEQCVEQIFLDVLARCQPQRLSVHARYTRRGGLDINPWRATPGEPAPPALRDLRQ
jgi:7-cyano-7-deazaguanine reductase